MMNVKSTVTYANWNRAAVLYAYLGVGMHRIVLSAGLTLLQGTYHYSILFMEAKQGPTFYLTTS